MLTHGSLFAGIGGFDLGFERAGIKTVWQVEIDPYCRRTLRKNFPNVKQFRDIRRCGVRNLPAVDIISGGFPCQDISAAGPKVGIDGPRSGLWREFYRVICELRPQLILVENVSDLLIRGVGRVLGDLAAAGFDAEWTVLTGCAFGAPHMRQRLFILAYAQHPRLPNAGPVAEPFALIQPCGEWRNPEACELHLRREIWDEAKLEGCGLADGVPSLMDAWRALGNTVVPQIAEWIGRRIVEAAK